MLKLLTRVGVRRGLLGQSRGWFAVLVAVTGLRVLRRMAGKEPKVVYREELEPGQSVIITGGRPVATLPANGANMEA